MQCRICILPVCYRKRRPRIDLDNRIRGWFWHDFPRCLESTLDRLEKLLIYITPSPIFAGFERLDDGMFCRLKVASRVSILRGVTTSNVTAGFAKTQVNPGISCFQAILATVGAGGHVPDLIDMPAIRFHLKFLVSLSLASQRLTSSHSLLE